MRIGLVTHTTAGRGGIEQVVSAQVLGLRRRGHEVQVLTGPEIGAGTAARAFASAGLVFARTKSLARCDVLLAHYAPAPLVAKRTGRPFVHYLHHPLRAAHPTQTQRAAGGLAARAWHAAGSTLAGLDRAGVRAAAAVAVPSPAVAAEVARLYDVQAEVLPLGVDAGLFTPGGQASGSLLFVGRPDEPYKHLDWALEVARRLGRPIEVVGDSRSRAVDGVDVRWRGYLSGTELVAAYRRAAVLLFPSVHEDFGLVPLEALACGLPVVAWDDGHGPSSTLAGASGGVLVPAYDLDAFTEAARLILTSSERQRELAAAGPGWVAAGYSVERHLDRLVELLARVVEEAA
jgi:glycosyltransferase involved in cell wall biosynthesis